MVNNLVSYSAIVEVMCISCRCIAASVLRPLENGTFRLSGAYNVGRRGRRATQRDHPSRTSTGTRRRTADKTRSGRTCNSPRVDTIGGGRLRNNDSYGTPLTVPFLPPEDHGTVSRSAPHRWHDLLLPCLAQMHSVQSSRLDLMMDATAARGSVRRLPYLTP